MVPRDRSGDRRRPRRTRQSSRSFHCGMECAQRNAGQCRGVARNPAPTAPSAGEARQPPAAEPLPAATEVPGAPPPHDYMAEYEANQARTEDAEPPPEPTVDTTFQQRRGEQLANEEAQEEEVLRQHVIDMRRRENEAAVAAAHEQWATPNKIVPSFLRSRPRLDPAQGGRIGPRALSRDGADRQS